METHSHTAIDKDYIDHAIKFMEHWALGDNDPVLDTQLRNNSGKTTSWFSFLQVFLAE